MAKTRKRYTEASTIKANREPPSIGSIALKVPKIVMSFDKSMVKQAQEKPDWKLYRIEIREGVPYIVREMCDRCGKVKIPSRWRKLRSYIDEDGEVFLETGICKDCINASVYVDKYLDGEALTETEAKKLFYAYGTEYERNWRVVLAAAPVVHITEAEWKKACKFFGGCAMCCGPIEIQAKFFPKLLNGMHTAWNIIPMCKCCYDKHIRGRVDITKSVHNYKVFCTHQQFQKMKTVRMYLLRQMELHNLFIEPLQPWRKRFFETKTLEGSD